MRQFSGNLIIVPNSKMASNIIINHTMPHPDLTVTLSLALAPDNDLQKIETIAMAVGEAVGTRLLQEKNPRKKPEAVTPVVRYRAPGESWINLNLSLPFKTVLDAGWVRHELLKALLIRFNEENINLAFPQHIVHIREGSLGGGNEPPESVAAAK